uniref:Pancreatic progenitor cell differentiation and proliferation factor n=1 Tax=Prolemur simus TaxID=1328070 RepID=A0A8C9DJA9_PROSS
VVCVPKSGADFDYYRRCLGSASSSSSCGSAERPGEAILHHPGLPKADPGHWWVSFFFGKSALPFMTTVVKSPEHSEAPQASRSMPTCGLAPNYDDATALQPGKQRETLSPKKKKKKMHI